MLDTPCFVGALSVHQLLESEEKPSYQASGDTMSSKRGMLGESYLEGARADKFRKWMGIRRNCAIALED